MYKSFKSKRFYLAFNTFPKTAKNISKVYHTGMRNWDADDAKYYTIVIRTFRIMFAINKDVNDCCNG